ncbi:MULTISPECIES: ABC transporter ATP-binding protein [Streptacidiphilus]|uniref:ABC transporter ATP-binding protein n=2 Tax=Streptacidiphilus TaxID=228398 RepID=A0ABV6UYM6_9ACTN|nr:ABC transporter ATP-binding protein [Streptacidiphilus jeojiense]
MAQAKKQSSRKAARPPLLALHQVSRRYGGRVALQPVDLDLAAGECVALVGHNGSGKSTMLRLAAGRDTPTSGTVKLDGVPMDENDPRVRARLAVVGDVSACYPDLTVREHLALVAVAHGVEEPLHWVDRALADRGLAEHAEALPGSLSSGQLQSLLLASALVRPRDLLILDEPEQRLDPGARQRLADLLKAELADGVAVLLATHHPDLAMHVADRVLLLEDGVLLAQGTPEAVLPTAFPGTAVGGAR